MKVLAAVLVSFLGGFCTCGLLYPDLRGLVDEIKAHITSELNRIVGALRR